MAIKRTGFREAVGWLAEIIGPDAAYIRLGLIYTVAISLLALATPISVQFLINSVAFIATPASLWTLSGVLFFLLLVVATLSALRVYVMALFERRIFARTVAGRRLLAERALPDDGASRQSGRTPARRSVSVNLAESPLGWLRARGLVTQRQYDAGERLRADWTMAGLGPRVTMRWDPAPVAHGARGPDAPLDPTLAGIAAKRRFDEAIVAAGPGLSDVLWRVVCSGDGLETAEATLGWPKRAGKLVLLMALDRIADYYRL